MAAAACKIIMAGRPIMNFLCFVLCLIIFMVIYSAAAPPIKASVSSRSSDILNLPRYALYLSAAVKTAEIMLISNR